MTLLVPAASCAFHHTIGGSTRQFRTSPCLRCLPMKALLSCACPHAPFSSTLFFHANSLLVSVCKFQLHISEAPAGLPASHHQVISCQIFSRSCALTPRTYFPMQMFRAMLALSLFLHMHALCLELAKPASKYTHTVHDRIFHDEFPTKNVGYT
jgi:hypothetical protein